MDAHAPDLGGVSGMRQQAAHADQLSIDEGDQELAAGVEIGGPFSVEPRNTAPRQAGVLAGA
jgi:hypothetical protein